MFHLSLSCGVFQMMNEVTYNKTNATRAFFEGCAVYCTHPDDCDVRLWSRGEIEDADGHLFAISSRKQVKNENRC